MINIHARVLRCTFVYNSICSTHDIYKTCSFPSIKKKKKNDIMQDCNKRTCRMVVEQHLIASYMWCIVKKAFEWIIILNVSPLIQYSAVCGGFIIVKRKNLLQCAIITWWRCIWARHSHTYAFNVCTLCTYNIIQTELIARTDNKVTGAVRTRDSTKYIIHHDAESQFTCLSGIILYCTVRYAIEYITNIYNISIS